jgi:hypothetical protein
MLEDGEAPFRLNLIDNVADTDRPKEQDLPSVRPTDLAGGPPGLKISFVTIALSQFSLTAPAGPPLSCPRRVTTPAEAPRQRADNPPGSGRTETTAKPGDLSSPQPPTHPGD